MEVESRRAEDNAWAARVRCLRNGAHAAAAGALREALRAREPLLPERRRGREDLPDAAHAGLPRVPLPSFQPNFSQISAKSSQIFASKIQESKCKKSTQAKNHPEIRTENRKHETTKRKTKPRSTTAALREQHHHAESH